MFQRYNNVTPRRGGAKETKQLFFATSASLRPCVNLSIYFTAWFYKGWDATAPTHCRGVVGVRRVNLSQRNPI